MNAGAEQGTPWWRFGLVWLVLAGLLVLINLGNLSEWRFPDPDDTLRLVQVRDLLAGQGWFDFHQYRINPGDPPVMHWSRLVDIPLALVILLFTPLFGQETAEIIAVFAIPLLTLAAVLAIVGRMAFKLFDREVAILACMAVGLLPILIFQLQPMRIDHHGWQIASVIFGVSALMDRKPWRGGALVGLAMGFGLSISLEVLPIAAGFALVLGLRWLRDDAQRFWLVAFLAGLAGSLALFFATTRGFADLTQYCDAIAPAHLGLFAIIAVLVGLISLRPGWNWIALGVLIGAAGAAGLAFYLWQAPQCTSGPFANLDPLVQKYWYENVLEGRPAWLRTFDSAAPIVAQGMVALGVVFTLWRKAEGERRTWWLEYGILLGVAFVTGMLVWRSMAFVGVIGAIPLGWLVQQLLQRIRATEKPLAKIGSAIVAAVVILPATPFALAKMVLPEDVAVEQVNMVRESSCEIRKYAPVMNQFAPTTIFAPIDIGPSVLERTHHAVIATGHHRAQDGMRDVIRAYTASPEQAEPIIRAHQASYLLVCTDLVEPSFYAAEEPDGLMAHLLNDDAPDWLEEVEVDAPDVFRVWKVKD